MHYDPEYLLKRFTDHFKQKYKVECISALHHNKRKTNYHIHLIFAERQLLDKPVEKIATRNMFYDEMGKHRRTKKEILDEAGNIRKRCRVVRKGEMYERKLFTKKNELFKADAPYGMNAVVKGNDELPPGVIYVLRNVKNEVNINSQNRLHPFYLVYMSDDGEVVIDHLSPKEMLDSFRYLCKGKTEPDKALCAAFNEETQDGRNMSKYSELLGDSIASIIEVKDENDMDSFLSGKQMSFLSETINGLDDFELISFLVIK